MIPISPDLNPPRYDEAFRRRRMGFLELGDSDVALLSDLAGILDPQLDAVVDRFYAYLTGFPDTRILFRDDMMVARLKTAQRTYLRQALRGPYDETYFRSRWRIGYVHNAIHLEPDWFIGAMQLYRRLLFPIVLEHYRDDPEALVAHLLALDKVMTLDMTIALDSYWQHLAYTTRQLEEANRRLEIVSLATGNFLSGVSHELRTPLNTIIGFSSALHDGIVGPISDAQRDCLHEIHAAGETLLRLIDGALQLARSDLIEAESLVFHSIPVVPLLHESIVSARESAERKGLALRTELPSDLGTLELDAENFRDAVGQLLSNAVKFTNSGEITVTARVVADQVIIEVRDTGIGISLADQARIFEPFVRVDSSHATPYEGLGLGLALVRRLAEAQGGRLWVDSRIGEGSTFHLLLPRRRPVSGASF